ncbi:hypothetical protein MPTK1_6g16300 [Marchantia polymorpha subsp. ruderalis]|uniref:Transmembrane protein n=2 Tax=Marchantia polymorpha TaxID=3197 RepID=A0AAF6BSN1_MARPO|nr:hypothetical protein MARPO_0056s0140 [Marchantia polymorpha]BBN15015.1 hypothetical protein Mp_6g16300 [Marchantia polymorpha subsp. ruderalis]|eukprot:PTQ37699.1 hypothetical protein MARPO_0056s0140 [Marchantia polymorpha]
MASGRVGAQQRADPDGQALRVVPFVVVALIVAHLLAFAYWIYRVAVEKQPQRRKIH